MKVITLAHGFTENACFHPYFGSNLVIDDIVNADLTNNGYVTINNLIVSRENGIVVKLERNKYNRFVY